MSDTAIPVAYAMNVSPKRYALFLGAGISISAGLPPGNEVAAQLIREHAAGIGQTIKGGDDPKNCFNWYMETTGRPPTFDLLMEDLGVIDQNRADALKPIILPDDEETGMPRGPTLAHKRIAQLVKNGLVNIIITTNFDPLLERAIGEVVREPVIITSESDPALMSIIPDKCRIIKVNGDFTSKELKITPQDLSSYDAPMSDYLRRIFEEYGLIVCGWSSEYDTGMIKILESVPLRRYPVFWCLRPDRKIPTSLINSLKPIPVEITTADEFFTDVQTIITRLDTLERRQPLTISLAVKKVTDALQQPRPEIILSDLIHKEADSIIDLISEKGYVPNGTVHIPDLFSERIELFKRATAPLAAMLATLAYYDDKYSDLLFDVIERLINVRVLKEDPIKGRDCGKFTGTQCRIQGILDCLYELRLLPALLVVYSAGITATKSGHFNMLGSILGPKIGHREIFDQQEFPYYDYVNPFRIFSGCDLWVGLNGKWFGKQGDFYSFLFEEVHKIIYQLIPSRSRYCQMYDIFEYLYALTFLNSNSKEIKINDIFHKTPVLETRLCCTTYRTSPPNALIFPPTLQSYFENFEEKISNSRFFDGNITEFKRSNDRYAKIFGIESVKIG